MDTDGFAARQEAEWWPALRARTPPPDRQARERWTPDERRAWTIHHPEAAPAQVRQAYPAHLHLNLTPRLQGRGLGRRLFETWRAAARDRLAERATRRAVHVGANRGNPQGITFWRRMGFEDVALLPSEAAGRTLWLGRLL